MIIRAGNIQNEVLNAIKQLKERRRALQVIVDGYSGRTSLDRMGGARRLRVNQYYQSVAIMVPRMVSGDPRVKVTTPRNGAARASAMAGEAAVNEWIRQTNHRAFCQRMATDSVLGWGAAALTFDARSSFGEDDDDPRAWVTASRLDQGDAFWDPIATSWQTKAFSGHQYAILRDKLIERAETEVGWDMAKVKALPVDSGMEEIGRPHNAPKRGEVLIREVWLPHFRLPNAPEFSNGTIFTLGINSEGQGSFPRAPQSFFGPPWGPVYLYDTYYVPGQSLGMSVCEAVQELVEEVNRHAEKLSTAIARRKSIGVGDKVKAADVEAINACPDGNVVLLDGLKDAAIQQLELGGATNEQRQAFADIWEQLQRESGMDDATRGLATDPNVTATATATASASAGVRIGYVAQRFADCDEMLLQGVLWYVVHSRALKIKIDPAELGITPESLEANGMDPELASTMETEIQGGTDAGMTWDDYTLRLDRYSMERTSEGLQQQRAMQLMNITLQLAQVAPQIAAYTDIRKLMHKLGDAFNIQDFGEIIGPEQAAQVAQQQAAAQEKDQEPEYEMPGPKAGRMASSATR